MDELFFGFACSIADRVIRNGLQSLGFAVGGDGGAEPV